MGKITKLTPLDDDLNNCFGGYAWENNKYVKRVWRLLDVEVGKKYLGKDKYYYTDPESHTKVKAPLGSGKLSSLPSAVKDLGEALKEDVLKGNWDDCN